MMRILQVLLALCTITSLVVADTAFKQGDTTPPAVSAPRPAPDSTVYGNVSVSARFSDSGSGIKTSSARIRVDGRDVTREAKVEKDRITWTPVKPLTRGIHKVEISVSDKAGNGSNRLKWRFGVGTPAPVKAEFKDGVFRVNGEPFFPIGMYNYRCFPNSSIFEESRLAEVTEAGFNFMIYNAGDQRALDMLSKHGMKALLQTLFEIEQCTDPSKAYTALVERGPVKWKGHPAMLGYWADSPDATYHYKGLAQEDIAARMDLAYRTIREHDSSHPVVWCYAHLDTVQHYVGSGDATMSFFYPVGQKGGFKAPDISYYVIDKLRAAAPEKQTWFISQAIDLNIEYTGVKPSPQDFLPTPHDMRLMNYLALVDGVKGLCVYGSGGTRFEGIRNDLTEYPAQWNEALKLASEFRYLAPVLAAGKQANTAVLENPGKEPAVKFLELEHAGTHTLIAVNVTESPVKAVWQFKTPVQPVVLFEDRILSEKASSTTDEFKPYEVHIYKWKSDPSSTGKVDTR